MSERVSAASAASDWTGGGNIFGLGSSERGGNSQVGNEDSQPRAWLPGPFVDAHGEDSRTHRASDEDGERWTITTERVVSHSWDGTGPVGGREGKSTRAPDQDSDAEAEAGGQRKNY